jgi:hypothetical protein
MIFINDDGTGITRLDKTMYDVLMCKRNLHPALSRGPRPTGWERALKVIGERSYKIMQGFTGELPTC